LVWGENGQITISPSYPSVVNDGSSNPFSVIRTNVMGLVGLQVGRGAASVARICNLTADTGKGLTDALIDKALMTLPAGFDIGHTFVVMHRRSMGQLLASRTSYNPLGFPAAIPSEIQGAKVIVTDALSITETIIAD